MPTLVPVIISLDEHTPSEAIHDLYLGLFSRSSSNRTSLYQSTVACALTLAKPEQTITIAPFEYGSIIQEQLSRLHPALKQHILLEPSSNKTTAIISVAAHHALSKFVDPVLWIMPVHQASYYANVLKHGVTYSVRAAFQGRFVLFGMRPFKPDDRFAYMVTAKHLETYDKLQSLRMFVPHPNEQTLEGMWQQPYCLASSGVLLVSAQNWLNYMSDDMRDLTFESYRNSQESHYGTMINPEHFAHLPKQSLTKFLGLLSQQRSNPLATYTLPSDTSKLNGWYQLWQQSQTYERGEALEKFLNQIEHVT